MYVDQLIDLLRQHPSLSSPEIASTLALSQPTISRAIAAAGPRVQRLGRGRSTRYALVRAIAPYGSRWPLFRIDASGTPHELAELVALNSDRTVVLRSAPLLSTCTAGDGAFEGLPWYLDDARPQGFLGRIVARRLARVLSAPADPLQWTNDHVLAALLVDGDDAPGDLVLGENMLERALGPRPETDIPHDARAIRYAERAAAALVGDVAGSSAGGEQPKFTARVRGSDGQLRHVIVKFTDSGDSPVRQRWHDLLVAEHVASECLNDAGIPAARTAVLKGDRTFLEIERFDRIAERGRSGHVSLAALDNALHGARDDWSRAASRLERDGWIDPPTAQLLRTVALFGRLIANSDMHFQNVSFRRTDSRPFPLAPVYDMLPMEYRPAPTGELVDREFTLAPPMPRDAPIREWTLRLAAAYWERLATDERISVQFRRIAKRNAQILRSA